MCTERDRLIDYVYNECDAAERDRMQRHLDTCHECRAEVTSLRSVREDLLAWDVPAHESVWRPFAPAPVTVWWRQVPAWAMAAAAGLVIVSGAAGGAALQAFMPDQQQQAVPQTNVAANATPVTAADLSAAEQRWRATLREQVGALDARVNGAAVRTQPAAFTADNHDALVNELDRLRGVNKELVELLGRVDSKFESIRLENDLKFADLKDKLRGLQNFMNSQLLLK
jgi:anti-sigma factor RsiW